MSRTYRRKSTTKNGMCADLDSFVSVWIYPWKDEGSWISNRIFFEKNSKEYRKGKARFHSDAGTTSFKEPGPSWYRRMFQKMYRSRVRTELAKYMKNPDYEVNLHDSTEKYKMDYWT